MPAQARCKLTSAKVELEGEEDSAHHEEKHAGHDEEKHAGHDEEKHGEHEGEAIHSEFRVAYAFDCANVAALTQIGFPYFKAFPNAQELDVTLITGKGQKTYEVDRKTTRVSIRDML